ncbi:MAG TPA: hypothetical protein VJP02_27500 [Candidatus Sulfotelmatobacter sp.]|nr:hypothetical protein [Candidatus Sulfotelmatobacter sp.]
MRSILTSLTFLVFLVWSCIVLGGGLYEAIAVWPLVAADPPRSLAVTNQVLAVAGRAGMFFWSWATPGLGLVGLAALLTSFGTPRPHRTWRIASTVLLLVTVAATFLYFRPTIISLVVNHGGGQPGDEIAAQMRRWVMLNWVRATAVAVSIGMGVRALLLSKA